MCMRVPPDAQSLPVYRAQPRQEHGLPQSGDDRTRGEDRKTVASEALHGATEPTVGYARQARSNCDKIGERREMGEPRQPEVLLGEIQMGRSSVAKPGREARRAGRRQCGQHESGDADDDQARRRARRLPEPTWTTKAVAWFWIASAICADHEVPGLRSSLSNQTFSPAALASGASSSRRFSARAASVSAPEWLRKTRGRGMRRREEARKRPGPSLRDIRRKTRGAFPPSLRPLRPDG